MSLPYGIRPMSAAVFLELKITFYFKDPFLREIKDSFGTVPASGQTKSTTSIFITAHPIKF